jgi:gamma-glutamylcyclotransferase (GGCT)/AIG2-like uncharacterized protein YtfP
MLYFAYGANTHRPSMASRCPEAEFLGTARLVGYALTFRGVADICRSHDGAMEGALWDITESDLAALDRFEGYPRLYTRGLVRIDVRTTRRPVILAETARAWVYWMTPGHGQAHPSASYLETLRSGYAECALPTDQLDAALAALPPPDRGGHRAGYQSRLWG